MTICESPISRKSINMGGFGIRHAIQMAVPCFMSSIYSCADLIKLIIPKYEDCQESMQCQQKWTTDESLPLPPPDDRSKQKSWEIPLMNKLFQWLGTTMSTLEDKARYLAMNQPHVGDWLRAIPSCSIGTWLNNDQFHISCALRLG